MSSSTNSINNLIPKEVVKLVQNLVLVVSCKASGNLKAQEQLEKEQHEIWKEEARTAAINLYIAQQKKKRKRRSIY